MSGPGWAVVLLSAFLSGWGECSCSLRSLSVPLLLAASPSPSAPPAAAPLAFMAAATARACLTWPLERCTTSATFSVRTFSARALRISFSAPFFITSASWTRRASFAFSSRSLRRAESAARFSFCSCLRASSLAEASSILLISLRASSAAMRLLRDAASSARYAGHSGVGARHAHTHGTVSALARLGGDGGDHAGAANGWRGGCVRSSGARGTWMSRAARSLIALRWASRRRWLRAELRCEFCVISSIDLSGWSIRVRSASEIGRKVSWLTGTSTSTGSCTAAIVVILYRHRPVGKKSGPTLWRGRERQNRSQIRPPQTSKKPKVDHGRKRRRTEE